MMYHIEIKEKEGFLNSQGVSILKDIYDLGINSVNKVDFIQVYNLEGELTQEEITRIVEELLVDPVSQDYCLGNFNISSSGNPISIEIAYNPGVMDPVEESVKKGIKDLGINKEVKVKTARRYILTGNISPKEIEIISEKLLYNKLIQHVVEKDSQELESLDIKYKFNLIYIDLLSASEKKLLSINKERQLSLNLNELKQIQNYFRSIARNPTDIELETIAQTWSEHCIHKTFKGKIIYEEQIIENGKKIKRKKYIDNLLRSTIMKVTEKLNKPWCVSVFKDNAGIIKFNKKYNICFKVETHNHPSALEPYGGAATGIGGVIRDILGAGLGAKPIFNTDVFCFAPFDLPAEELPSGCLHPKRIIKGVVSGVRDYGNKMGIPTINGAVLFHKRFVGNPLVFCGTAGIMPQKKSFKEPKKGDLVVLLGGKTGRDGIHGATFSSEELTHKSEEVSSSVVQIGNPIQEKKILDVIMKASSYNLYHAITDCGGGGLSSAVGEMAKDLGVKVYLDKVPLKYTGLSYTEIWISESQERMILSVPKNNLEKLKKICEEEDVELSVIGEFFQDKRLRLYYKDNLVCDLDMEFLHSGIPLQEKKAIFNLAKQKEPKLKCPHDLTEYLLKALSHYNICSKEWIIRQYDHEVQAQTLIKPLMGKTAEAPQDAAVIKPLLDSRKAIAVSCGINFRYGMIDPYWMSASCIDEAIRQIISVGGSLERTAILDNFCWGNPDKPDRLGSLVRACFGCYDTALKLGIPFISGKDSLNNEYNYKGKSISIPGTLLISAISVIDDYRKVLTSDFKKEDSLIYIVGNTFSELGGSVYYDLFGILGSSVPKHYPLRAKATFLALSQITRLGLALSIHDCSDGGIAVALAEMSFGSDRGVQVFLKEVPFSMEEPRNDFILFSESNSRFIIEIPRSNQKRFESILKENKIPFGLIGCVSRDQNFRIYGLEGEICIDTDTQTLKKAWQNPMRW